VLRKILFLILGAIIGIIVVRSFVLVGVEQIYFDAIIESIKQGKSWDDSGIDMLLNSDTFAKTITGAIVGGVVGLILFTRLYKK
jgi:hypothetical protein